MASVLLVDDHPDLREVVEQLLQLHGHEVQCCDDAEQAMEMMSRHSPDVLIVDQRLPGISGLELLRHVRENPKFSSIQVIVCSADDSQREQARQDGAIDFWLKGSDRLFDAVAQLSTTLQANK